MKGPFSKDKIKQIMQETRQRIINAFMELRHKERSIRERAQEIVRDRSRGADPATS